MSAPRALSPLDDHAAFQESIRQQIQLPVRWEISALHEHAKMRKLSVRPEKEAGARQTFLLRPGASGDYAPSRTGWAMPIRLPSLS
jgi:hypothetical protein